VFLCVGETERERESVCVCTYVCGWNVNLYIATCSYVAVCTNMRTSHVSIYITTYFRVAMCTNMCTLNMCTLHMCTLHVNMYVATYFATCTNMCTLQPIPHGVSFSKAQSSKLERLFCYVSMKRDVRALSFGLWNSFQKCHPKWDWLYVSTCI